jgi:DNA mismatch repair ATPase MutS
MPAVEIGQTGEEIGFYLGAANLHKEWIKKGFPLTKPKIIDKKEKRARIINSYNTTLIGCCKEMPDPNDIISDKETNLFINTGPNNGGKTTYLRQVGQQYWLAQIGMLLPAKEAELSAVDGIFTSFSGEDNTKDGTGQYLTELRRVSAFTKSNNGASTTPYSLLLFDEFANGTDHEESVIRTKIVLDHISRKGITAYFTTHKQEIADYVEDGKLPGSMNLASEIKMNGSSITYTHKILRNNREKSYGSIQAEGMGITTEALDCCLDEEIARGAYPVEDTRVNGDKK